MISTIVAVVLWTFVAQSGAAAPAKPAAADLAAAKALYASGDYEEALNNLSAIKAEDSVDEVEEYRSLCLLALGRTAEAQRSLERLVTRSPLFKMSEADVSPRLITIFHDVRRRILPGTVRDLYAKAKANFEQGRYDVAKPQFEDLMTLLADDDLAEDAASLSDLKMLSDGFLKLANAQLTAKAEAAKATPTPTPKPAAAEEPPPTSPANRMYGVEDKEVTAPVDVKCPMPEWHPVTPAQMHDFHGVLRVIISTDGKVESASIVSAGHPAYDPLLLAAAKDWQYKPAMRDGQPVRYQKLIPFVLRPRVSASR
ncbi:MAG TPA: energy transducer TonB [Vicinamibacterales bacterium]|nr:energy transducer TonB [Vicinamibacterales bacterium]